MLGTDGHLVDSRFRTARAWFGPFSDKLARSEVSFCGKICLENLEIADIFDFSEVIQQARVMEVI